MKITFVITCPCCGEKREVSVEANGLENWGMKGNVNGKTFATTIRKALVSNGMNQRELALHLGVSGAAVSKWMNGTASPTHNHISKISAILNLDEEELLSSLGLDGGNNGLVFMVEEH